MTDWSDVVARARGLSGRLLGRDRLVEAARARDLPSLGELLARSGYPEIGDEARRDPVLLERMLRRMGGERLALLARWSAARLPLLAPLYEEEDCRSLRAILRGVIAGVPVEQRLSGLVPTPALPAAAVAELARQPDASHVVALLAAWRHPYGSALLGEATRPQPDAFRLQLALDRRYGERAHRAAEAAGAALLRHVQLQVDLANAWTALALAAHAVEHEPAELFVSGGEVVTLELFLECARAASAVSARAVLARRAAGTVVARVVGTELARWEQEDRALVEALALGRRESRVDPLSVGAILQYVLRLRAEIRDLGRIVWGIALDAPRALLARSLVTP